ncbi:MAG: VTT domain-containing protein [Actinomycetota bacterium]|nr:VTT domain-containing protein [Actinomycetota bacterium]
MIVALTPLLYVLGPVALLLVMAVVLAETGLLVGFFLPGDSLLFMAGVLVASSVIHLPIWLVALGVFIAAVAGDQVGYLIGRRLGPRVFSRPESRFFSPRHALRAEAFFQRYGPKAIILGRFIPVIRTFVPVVAGVGRMPHRTFTIFNAVGALGWAVGIVMAGFYLGGVAFVAAHVEFLTVGVVALSLIPAAIAVLRQRRRKPVSRFAR